MSARGFAFRSGLVLLVGLLAGGCRAEPSASLTLRFRLSAQHQGPFAQLRLRTDWAGVNHHRVRDADWRRVGLAPAEVLLEAGQPSAGIRGRLPAGDYSRVFIAVESIEGVDVGGGVQTIEGHIEPTALALSLEAGEEETVDIVIAILPSPPGAPHERRFEAFVMDAQLAPKLGQARPESLVIARAGLVP